MRLLITISFAVITLVACATTETIQQSALAEGVVERFDAPFNKVAPATLDAVRQLDVNITSTQQVPNGIEIVVSKPLSAFSWGEVGRIFIEKKDGAPTPVYVNWQKRVRTQLTGTSQSEFSGQLYADIKKILASR